MRITDVKVNILKYWFINLEDFKLYSLQIVSLFFNILILNFTLFQMVDNLYHLIQDVNLGVEFTTSPSCRNIPTSVTGNQKNEEEHYVS